jgi:hypothetical protein
MAVGDHGLTWLTVPAFVRLCSDFWTQELRIQSRSAADSTLNSGDDDDDDDDDDGNTACPIYRVSLKDSSGFKQLYIR